jgi:hypothetical protein
MFVTQSEVTLRDTIFVGCMSGEGGWGGARKCYYYYDLLGLLFSIQQHIIVIPFIIGAWFLCPFVSVPSNCGIFEIKSTINPLNLFLVVPEEGSKLLIEGCTFRDGYSNFGGGIDDGKLLIKNPNLEKVS